MEFAEMLMNFGLTRQEAQILITLHNEGSLTGYEAAKLSGLSRSNCYTALASLAEKGAAYLVEDSAVHYIPVPIEEFCGNKIRLLEDLKQQLSNMSPVPKNGADGYITIKGEQNIMDKIYNMITSAKERIYFSVSRDILTRFKNELKHAAETGIKVVIITNPPFEMDKTILYPAKNPLEQIRIITDSSEILTGDINDTKSCLYSKNKNLVDLFKNTLRNEMRLIELGEL